LPPVTRSQALAILARLRVAALLAGARGRPPADLDAVADAIVAMSRLALDLGDALQAMDINPLICGPSGAIAADVLVIARLSVLHMTSAAVACGVSGWLAAVGHRYDHCEQGG
jgi:hypothetical protein